MRIGFLGASAFGYALLETLIKKRYDIVAIMTLPQKFRISYSPKPITLFYYKDFNALAVKYNIPLIRVRRRLKDYFEKIKEFSPDLILVLGWYHFVPKNIRALPRKGCIGIHASLLPSYAGGSPLVWAIINGETETGVSMFYLNEGIDSGDIIAQRKFSIRPNDDIVTLYQKATNVSTELLLEYLPRFELGNAPRYKQNFSLRSIYPQRSPKDGKIDWTKSTREIRDFIRAQTKPYPGAFCYLNRKKLTIWKAEFSEKIKTHSMRPGKIIEVEKDKFTVATNDGLLTITDYEPKDIIFSKFRRLV